MTLATIELAVFGKNYFCLNGVTLDQTLLEIMSLLSFDISGYVWYA